ncbi:MAG: UvrB/UvrC motif-containing protein [Planctomycetes bacterium]|nr:UvrB/UvrC motif-containing protein [Planctomycetota bacterium]
MSELLTDRAVLCLAHAQEEAKKLQHDAIRTEHILLGLLREGGGLACAILQNVPIDLSALREEILKGCPPGQAVGSGNPPPSALYKKVLELASEESRNLGHPYIGTEHLLLGLLRENEGIAGLALRSLGISLEKARQWLLTLVQASGASPAAAAPKASQSDKASADSSHAAAEGRSTPSPLPDALFERVTQRVRKCLENAQQEALKRNHPFVGTEHLLLGLLRDESGVACSVLKKLGVEFKAIQEAVDRHTPPGKGPVKGEVAYSARALRVLQWAYREAQNMQHRYVGTEHLLLGLLREEQCIAAQVLHGLGSRYQAVREEIVKILGIESSPRSREGKGASEPARRETTSKKQPARSDAPVRGAGPPAADPAAGVASGARIRSEYSRDAAEIVAQIQEVERQKQLAIQQEKFEEAGRCRDQLLALSEKLEGALKGNHTVTFTYDDETVQSVLQLMRRYWQLKSEGVDDAEILNWIKLQFFRLPEFALARQPRKRQPPPPPQEKGPASAS